MAPPHAPAPNKGGHGLAIGLVVLLLAALVCLALAVTGVIPALKRKAVTVPPVVAASTTPLPVDCALGPWTDWSDCSAAGTQTRTRAATVQAANGGQACGALIDTQACTYIAPLDGVPFAPTAAGMVGGKLGPGLTWKQAVGGQGASGSK